MVQVAIAKEALETAQKMKGDENAVIAVAQKWQEAARRIGNAEKPLAKSWNSLTSDWDGGAYSFFRWHMTRNAEVAVHNSNALLAAENALLDLALQVANSYNLAVDLTTLAASRIQPALGGYTLTGKKEDDKPAIANAITDYVEAVNKIDNSLRTALSSQKVGLAKFASSLAVLREPNEFEANATNPKRWVHK